MTWDPSVLFEAFEQEGMNETVTLAFADGSTSSFSAGFSQPDRPFGDNRVQSTEYEIEYQTASAVNLRDAISITVKGVAYVRRAPPSLLGDGTYSHVLLTKV